MVDLQTVDMKEDGLTSEAAQKGQALLEAAWKAQGMDKLHEHKTYSVTAVDHWKGLMGKMGKVWPESKGTMELRYAVGSFDSQVEFLDGKEEGLLLVCRAGITMRSNQGKKLCSKKNQTNAFGLVYQPFIIFSSCRID